MITFHLLPEQLLVITGVLQYHFKFFYFLLAVKIYSFFSLYPLHKLSTSLLSSLLREFNYVNETLKLCHSRCHTFSSVC